MGWGPLIAILIQTFGPLLTEWLRAWLDNLLNRAADRLPQPASFNSPIAARVALFDAALDGVPRWAFARRTLLRALRSAAVRGEDLTPEAVAEIQDAAGAADRE